MATSIVSIILAIVCFLLVFIVGIKTDLLKVSSAANVPYSFHKTQLWLWTLVIIPCIVLAWGFVSPLGTPVINDTALILLGISGGTALVAEIITATQKASFQKPAGPGIAPNSLKSLQSSSSFWTDILTDDNGQISVLRLQNLTFTLVYLVVYISLFVSSKALPDFEGEKIYILMGISTGTYLIGKGLSK